MCTQLSWLLLKYWANLWYRRFLFTVQTDHLEAAAAAAAVGNVYRLVC